MKTKFIAQLDDQIQKKIKEELINFFKKELNLSNKEIEEEIEIAMNSRLIDLENSIDIRTYID